MARRGNELLLSLAIENENWMGQMKGAAGMLKVNGCSS